MGHTPITVGFKSAATVDELRISAGDAKDEAAWKAKNRVRKLVVREDRFTREIIRRKAIQSWFPARRRVRAG